MKQVFIMLAILGVFSGCGLQNQINDLKSRSDQNEGNIRDIKSRVAVLESQMASARLQLISLNNALSEESLTLQSSISSALAQIAVLQGYSNIVSIKDPCGVQGAYNEVLLKLSTGRYLSSFSDNALGLNTRFALLGDGDFLTTDGSNCHFTMSNGGTVISNEHN